MLKQGNRYMPDDIYNSEYASYYPSSVEIEITQKCNIQPPCFMCAKLKSCQQQYVDLSDFLFDWSKEVIVNSKEFSVNCAAEPMMSDKFPIIINMPRQDAFVRFFTNAHLMNEEKISAILFRPVYHIDVSCDAATNETYQIIRGRDIETFDLVKNNVRQLIKKRNELGLKKPTVNLVMVLMKINYKELPRLVDLAYDLGCDGVRCWMVLPEGDPNKKYQRFNHWFSYVEQTDIDCDELASIVQEANDRAKKLGLTFQREF
jgi:MoaA/NifB/PqqE/SkfB family radical SAM enzyme